MSNVYIQHKPGGSDDLYLRLKDGDKVKLRLASDPVITVYKPGDRPRYAWVVWNRDKNKAQVYNSGVSVYSQIADLVEEWGNPTEFDVTIKRTGSGLQDTEYSVVPVKTSDDLTPTQQEEVAKIDLPQATKGKWLKEYLEDNTLPDPITDGSRDTNLQDVVAPMPTDDDAPIDLDSVIPF